MISAGSMQKMHYLDEVLSLNLGILVLQNEELNFEDLISEKIL